MSTKASTTPQATSGQCFVIPWTSIQPWTGCLRHTEFSTVTAMVDPGCGQGTCRAPLREALTLSARHTSVEHAQQQRSPLKETWSRGSITPSLPWGAGAYCQGLRSITPSGAASEEATGAHHSHTIQSNGHLADLHPASNYKCFNSSSVSVHSWSWNYRGCWHQTCPPVDTHHCVWIASIPSPTHRKDRQDCCSSLLPHQECFSIGQFARLLPTLVVVAISQAPSPEPNPDSLSPVTATVVQDTTVQADRSEARVIKQCCGHGPPLCQRNCPQTHREHRDQPESAFTHYPVTGAGLANSWVQSTTGSATWG